MSEKTNGQSNEEMIAELQEKPKLNGKSKRIAPKKTSKPKKKKPGRVAGEQSKYPRHSVIKALRIPKVNTRSKCW